MVCATRRLRALLVLPAGAALLLRQRRGPGAAVAEAAWGQPTGGCFGHPRAAGGFAGSHAEYVRVPYADVGAFTVPDPVSDDRAVFASDAAPAGWMGAELGAVAPR